MKKQKKKKKKRKKEEKKEKKKKNWSQILFLHKIASKMYFIVLIITRSYTAKIIAWCL